MEQSETLIRGRNDLINLVKKLNKGEIIFDEKKEFVKDTIQEIVHRINTNDSKFITTIFMAINTYKAYEVCQVDPVFLVRELDRLFVTLVDSCIKKSTKQVVEEGE